MKLPSFAVVGEASKLCGVQVVPCKAWKLHLLLNLAATLYTHLRVTVRHKFASIQREVTTPLTSLYEDGLDVTADFA